MWGLTPHSHSQLVAATETAIAAANAASGHRLLVAPCGASKHMLVFNANLDGTDRNQGSRLLNEIALKSHRTVVIRLFTKVWHDHRFNICSMQTARQGPILEHVSILAEDREKRLKTIIP